jgi:G3E family GTPase
MAKSSPIPVTILTGFLGAGKTTLLNFIMSEKHAYRFGIIINELGELGIDDQLIETRDEEVMLMRNGCVCCTIRKDLVESIQKLVVRHEFDYLLIETTGIADPAPIAQTFYNFPALSPYVRLDSIVTLVDAEHIDEQARETNVCVKQIVAADFILLNKVDLSNEADLARIERSIRRINPHAMIYRSEHSAIGLHHILDVNAFNMDAKIVADPEFLHELHLHGHEAISAVSLRVSGLLDAFRFKALWNASA